MDNNNIPTPCETAIALMEQAGQVAIDSMPQTDENGYLRHAVAVRMLEVSVLSAQACGLPYDWDRSLAPIARAIDDTIRAIDIEVNSGAELFDMSNAPSEEEVDLAIAMREASNQWLDQARITGVLFLAHLTAARKLL